MAKLSQIEKSKLENLFKMDGYVLDFTDAKFASFFRDLDINIDDPKYTINKSSQSKANRLRGFWEQESGIKVGRAIEELINYAEYRIDESAEGLTEKNRKLIADCRNIANKLIGKPIQADASLSEGDFLASDFGKINFSKVPIESQLQPILENRLKEAQICLEHGANLAVVFMAGSMLEGVLLGVAQKYSRNFNESRCSPKNNNTGKPEHFNKWTLSQLIDAGREIGLLGEDVKKFSHALRAFRNYIHPYQQMTADFYPDKETATICLQVLKAALLNLENNKPT